MQLQHGLISFFMLLFSSSMKARWKSSSGDQPLSLWPTARRLRQNSDPHQGCVSVFLRQPQRLWAEGDSRSNFSDDKPISKEVWPLIKNQKTVIHHVFRFTVHTQNKNLYSVSVRNHIILLYLHIFVSILSIDTTALHPSMFISASIINNLWIKNGLQIYNFKVTKVKL